MRFIAIGLALLLSGCGDDGATSPAASAPEPAAVAEPAPVAVPQPKQTPAADLPAPLLWVVDTPNGPSYLQGTMHLGIDVTRDVHPIVFDKLDASQTFIMEVDVGAVDPFAMSRMAQLPEGKTLDALLTDEQWDGLVEIAPLPADQLRSFRPWFVLVAVTQSLLPATAPMDGTLQARASQQGLDIVFLEEWTYQVEMLDNVIGKADLVDLVDNFDDTKQELEGLAEEFRAGDADAIAAIMFDPEEYEKNPKVVDRLINERNRLWIPKLVPHLKKGRVFVAVGVGHLLGDESVIALLRKRGFTIERIRLPERRRGPATDAPRAPGRSTPTSR